MLTTMNTHTPVVLTAIVIVAICVISYIVEYKD